MFRHMLPYFLASSTIICTMWSFRPTVAFTARYHRITVSSLASPARWSSSPAQAINIMVQNRHLLRNLPYIEKRSPYDDCGKYGRITTKRLFMASSDNPGDVRFKPGDKVQVEVVSFGPMGASVEVIGLDHGDDVPLLEANAPEAYGYGLILQKEISYFRSARNNIDVVRGEILPAYIQNVRPEDGKLDISLRNYGGKAKSLDAGAQIQKRLEEAGGMLEIGEKSSPEEINGVFPGMSKSVFKKALGGLYKRGLVRPGKKSIELM